MAVIDRRTGLEIPESGFGGGALDFLYGNVFGRILLKYVAAAPWFSRWRGGRRDRPESKDDILPFLEENRIDLSDGGFGPGWQADGFATFNEFFTRQRDYGAYYAALREHGLLADPASERAELPAVADARLSVWSVGPDLAVPVIREFVGKTSLPLIFKPNAGKPILAADGTTATAYSAKVFADEVMPALDFVDYVGGCCGADPSYIRELAARMGR